MKTCIITACCAIIISLPSCLTSFQPLVTADKIVEETRVKGHWNSKEGDVEVVPLTESKLYADISKSFTKGSGTEDTAQTPPETGDMERKAYVISYKRDNIEYNMAARLMRINGSLYMDLVPFTAGEFKAEKESGLAFNMNYAATCTIAKVEITDNNHMVLHFANGEFIKKQLLAGNMRLKHEYDPLFGTFLVTASSEELQQFVAKYGDDERLFGKTNSFTLNRKG